MNTEALAPRLERSFERCALLPETDDIFRCERIYKDTPRSVYFFKAGADVPSPEELSRIHHDVVGPSYFLAKDALRWNHYFVLVADDSNKANEEFRARCRQFESNKDYARKLVVFDSELGAFIDRSIMRPDADGPARTVVELWRDQLLKAGLSAIESPSARTEILKAIRKGTAKSTAAQVVPKEPLRKSYAIDSFTVERFGTRKLAGTFEFGRVNLIRGPNGSGKTSLLESIEYYLCGCTSRSGGESEGLVGQAAFAGTPKPVPYVQGENQKYRERAQRWYGRTATRGNPLWEGFSRFNFLSTDAAVHFSSDSTQHDLSVALSKIALGPEASFLWNRIVTFVDDIARELPPIKTQLTNLDRSIKDALAREKVLMMPSPNTQSAVVALLESLDGIAWPVSPDMELPPTAAWFQQFAPLRDVVSALIPLDKLRSIAELDKELFEHTVNLQNLQALTDASKIHNSKELALKAAQTRNQARLERLQRLLVILESGLLRWMSEERRLENEISRISRQVIAWPELDALEAVGTDLGLLQSKMDMLEATLARQLVNSLDREKSLEQERTAINRSIADLDSIVSSIRGLGHQYTERFPNGEECPMCRTKMDMEDLVRRLNAAAGQTAQTVRIEQIAKEIAAIQSSTRKLQAVDLTIRRARDEFGSTEPSSAAELITTCRQVHVSHKALISQLAAAKTQREAVEKLGTDISDLPDLVSFFQSVPEWKSLSAANAQHVKQLIAAANQESAILQQDATSLQDESAITSKQLQELFGTYRCKDEASLRKTILNASQLLRTAKSAFEALPESVQARHNQALLQLVARSHKPTQQLDGLSAQLQAEHAKNIELNRIKTQLSRDQPHFENLNGEYQRLEVALKALKDITEKHSLGSGLTKFLMENLASIQQVFSRIHVPHELRLTGLDGAQLERIGQNREVKLTQISTGQRAALMLSVFLTLNLSLRQGPPQILIDDPVAHVDDLNSLSFLDFLADVAETADRQIFFATANDKLANLFQKKMEFLGSEFRTIYLSEQR